MAPRRVPLDGGDVTHEDLPAALWHGVRRRLSPSYGARANAADGLEQVRRAHDDRAEAERALGAARVPLPRDGSTR